MNNNNIGESIRRISKYEYLLKLIKEAQATANQAKKEYINANKIIAYSSVGGALSGLSPNNDPSVNPISQTGAQAAAQGAINAALSQVLTPQKDGTSQAVTRDNMGNAVKEGDLKGSTLTDPNLNGKPGWYDAQSILDGVADEYGKSPPAPSSDNQKNDTSNREFTADIVDALSGLMTDDETRQTVVSFLDATFGTLFPDDWEDPFSPGVHPEYVDGSYWTLASGATQLYDQTFTGLCGQRSALDGSVARFYDGTPPYLDEPSIGSPMIFTFSPTFDGGTVYNYSSDGTVAFGEYGTETCSGGDPGSSTVCSLDPPLATSWTDLGATQLGWISPYIGGIHPFAYEAIGRFMPNPFDINVPENYMSGSSILDLKTLDGTPIRIWPLADGGWAIYERNPADNNLPAGSATANSVYVIRADRTVRGFITPNLLATLIPR